MTYDVVIVGAGPSGLTTALFLLKARPELRGRILVLERKRFPREKICAGAMGARADRVLGEGGIYRHDLPVHQNHIGFVGVRWALTPHGEKESGGQGQECPFLSCRR